MSIPQKKFSDKDILSILALSKDAFAVYSTEDIIIEMANDAMLSFWSKDKSVIGLPLAAAVPELEGQPFIDMLKQVYHTGVTNAGVAVPAVFPVDGKPTTFYYDYEYRAIKNEAGETYCILHTAADVTEGETKKLSLENRLRYMLNDVPVAIAVLTGPDMIIESANHKMLHIWGKTGAVLGKPLIEGMPELEGQDFIHLLDSVFVTGHSHYGNEVRALIEQNGVIEEVYTNFVYHPFKNQRGIVESILVVANLVTDQVLTRKKVEHAEESLRQAVEAAELGTYYIDLETKEFVTSPRMKEFFGFAPHEEVPYEAAIGQIREDHRQQAADLVTAAITTGIRFDMEYPVVGHNDNKTRWVRGIGTIQKDKEGNNRYFTGVLHEITDKKIAEIRKNDFIGMVSHELKTPLTSLKGYVQIMQAHMSKSEDALMNAALAKLNSQITKMSRMINSFLDVSMLEAGKFHLNIETFPLDELLAEVLSDTSLLFTRYTFTYENRVPVTITADRDKISNVILNLLSNAVKYSPDNVEITATCSVINNEAVVSIQDRGIGIDDKHQQKLFDRYYRVSDDNTVAGFGIGLYFCQEIIQRHNGKIGVQSKPGEGSTFSFSLPLG